MTDEEFATMIQAVLADADDGGLSVEVQIEVPSNERCINVRR